MYIAQTVYVLHHSTYIAICSIDVIIDDFDRFGILFYFEIDKLASRNFFFLPSSQKFVFAISSSFQLNFMALVFKLIVILFGVKAWYFCYSK